MESKPQAGAHLTDAEVASRVRMLMRDQLDHEAVCVTARDRINLLSAERDQLRAEVERLRGELRAAHEDNAMGAHSMANTTVDATARAEAAEAHAADLRRSLEKIAEMDWANAATNAMGYRANKVATSAIARTPAHSLAAIESRVLRELCDGLLFWVDADIKQMLRMEAARREEATNGH